MRCERRRKSRELAALPSDISPEPADVDVEVDEQKKRLAIEMTRLKPIQNEILRMHFSEGWT